MTAATLPPPTPKRATIDDLMKTEGKAELIGGKVVKGMVIGIRHSRVASRIFIALERYERESKLGYAFDDNLAFRVPELSSGRETFSPDAAFVHGIVDLNDPGYYEGPPTFAAEVRSPEEYGPAAERAMAGKRDDYFEAGTAAVWDVDPQFNIVTLYIAGQIPKVFRRGELADAGPGLPGWSMAVDEIFGPQS